MAERGPEQDTVEEASDVPLESLGDADIGLSRNDSRKESTDDPNGQIAGPDTQNLKGVAEQPIWDNGSDNVQTESQSDTEDDWGEDVEAWADPRGQGARGQRPESADVANAIEGFHDDYLDTAEEKAEVDASQLVRFLHVARATLRLGHTILNATILFQLLTRQMESANDL